MCTADNAQNSGCNVSAYTDPDQPQKTNKQTKTLTVQTILTSICWELWILGLMWTHLTNFSNVSYNLSKAPPPNNLISAQPDNISLPCRAACAATPQTRLRSSPRNVTKSLKSQPGLEMPQIQIWLGHNDLWMLLGELLHVYTNRMISKSPRLDNSLLSTGSTGMLYCPFYYMQQCDISKRFYCVVIFLSVHLKHLHSWLERLPQYLLLIACSKYHGTLDPQINNMNWF